MPHRNTPFPGLVNWLHVMLCVVYLVAFYSVLALDENNSAKASTNNVSESAESRERRASSFVRIGRPSSFVRIGKDLELDSNVKGSDDKQLSEGAFQKDFDKKASSFVRIGRGAALHRFIRIGRMLSPGGYLDENMDGMDGDTQDLIKRQSHFVRIGKAPSNFVRIGKGNGGYENQADQPFRSDKRESNFVRFGKSLKDQIASYKDTVKRIPQFVRIGKGFDRDARAPSNFVRIGKASLANMLGAEKRPSSFVRIGKNAYNMASHPTGYLDIDHAGLNAQDLKRASSFVRIGRPGADDGKRASSFVRIGKGDGNEAVKRPSSFVRIGKEAGHTFENDRLSSIRNMMPNFVRLGDLLSKSLASSKGHDGKSSSSSSSFSNHPSKESTEDGMPHDNNTPIDVQERGHAFVRIGKIPTSAFVRIGKNAEYLVEPDLESAVDYSGRGLRSSSFVRIGK